MGRIARSFLLVRQSFALLMRDKELMVLPLLSGVIVTGIIVTAVFGLGINQARFEERDPAAIAMAFGLAVVMYAVGIFFQAAVVAGATERLRGGDPTVGSALEAASRRFGRILLWAVVAATVGLFFRALEDKLGFIGKIAVRIVGVAWSMATLFVVPALVLEDLSVRDSFGRSVQVYKATWGESMVGNVNLGVAAFVAWVSLVAATGLAGWAGAGIWSLALFIPGAVFLMVLFSTLQGVFIASLYRYVTAGATDGFDRELFTNAFVQKAR